MPSSSTITAFYNFSANTKARASQVNTNFDVFRGHIIPVHPSTATSSDSAYDLGSTDYRWRYSYVNYLNVKSNTTTGEDLNIIGDTAAGASAFLVKRNTQAHARIGGGNQYFDTDTTTSQIDFKVAGSTVGSIKSNGFNGNLSGRLISSINTTISAGLGDVAISSGFNTGTLTTTTAGAVAMSGSTCTLAITGNRPVFVGFIQRNAANPSEMFTSKITNSVELISLSVDLKRNGGIISVFYPAFESGMTALGFGVKSTIFPMNMWTLDFPATTTVTYSADLTFNVSSANIWGGADGRVVAFEL